MGKPGCLKKLVQILVFIDNSDESTTPNLLKLDAFTKFKLKSSDFRLNSISIGFFIIAFCIHFVIRS